MKLSEYVWYFYKTYRQPLQREISRISTESLLRNHIDNTKLGNMEISEIRTKDLQEYLIEQKQNGRHYPFKAFSPTAPLSNYMMIKLRQLLIAVLEQAERDELVRKNYAKDTSPFPRPYQNAETFTPELQRKFLNACKGHRFYTAYALFFYTGCRRSEILGLSWNNIDLRKNIITINQTLTVIHNKPTVTKTTKTKSSNRVIPIPKELKELLVKWRTRQRRESHTVANYSNDYNLVFTNKDGTPHNPSYFTRNFKAMLKKIDAPNTTLHLHSTRHTWATNMLQLGIPITDVQALGGWSRADTLLNVYAHTVKDSQRKAMKKLYKEMSKDDENND